MKRAVLLLAAGLLLSGCNDTSSNSYDGNYSGGSRSSAEVETFTVDATAVDDEAGMSTVAGMCEPEEADPPTGILAYRSGDQNPTKLVVFAHGYGHDVHVSWLPHVYRTVREDVVVIATNYRDNDGFPVLRGAHDTIAATLMAFERFPTIETVYLMGVSMGGAVSGTAISEAGTLTTLLPEGRAGLYDYWIDAEGVSQLAETWAEASAVQPETAAEIERDTGGTPATCAESFARRSPALNSFNMAATGLRAATVIHSVNDGLVPYNQAREMADALVGANIPTQMYTILGMFPGYDPGTTGTGHVEEAAGVENPNPFINLAGHASEADAFHPVMRIAFRTLDEMLAGTYDESALYQETVVDVSGEYAVPPASDDGETGG